MNVGIRVCCRLDACCSLGWGGRTLSLKSAGGFAAFMDRVWAFCCVTASGNESAVIKAIFLEATTEPKTLVWNPRGGGASRGVSKITLQKHAGAIQLKVI